MSALDQLTPAARQVLEEAGMATEDIAQHLVDRRGDWPPLTDDQVALLRAAGCPLPVVDGQELDRVDGAA